MIAGHESEKKNRERKKRRKDMGLPEPEREITHKKKAPYMHSKRRGAESNRV